MILFVILTASRVEHVCFYFSRIQTEDTRRDLRLIRTRLRKRHRDIWHTQFVYFSLFSCIELLVYFHDCLTERTCNQHSLYIINFLLLKTHYWFPATLALYRLACTADDTATVIGNWNRTVHLWTCLRHLLGDVPDQKDDLWNGARNTVGKD